MIQSTHSTSVKIPLENVVLKGDITVPDNAHAMVIFAHGSGSSRLSPRNQMVAQYLNNNGLATCLFDLLTLDEDSDYENRFHINMLAERLVNVTIWLTGQDPYKKMRIGFFGASTGAAAALIASTELPEVAAIVSRGGRPDLAMSALPAVKAPTLLIVGGQDSEVLQMNKEAFLHIPAVKKFEIIPGATHLFEESGAMERVCVVASKWFEHHLQPLELPG